MCLPGGQARTGTWFFGGRVTHFGPPPMIRPISRIRRIGLIRHGGPFARFASGTARVGWVKPTERPVGFTHPTTFGEWQLLRNPALEIALQIARPITGMAQVGSAPIGVVKLLGC
jgi:hypothetical protein